MLPSARLFTWIDVEEVIQTAMEKSECPDVLVWVRAYWDGLVIGIKPDQKKAALRWLSDIFEPRFDINRPAIILESLPDRKRFLGIIIAAWEKPITKKRSWIRISSNGFHGESCLFWAEIT